MSGAVLERSVLPAGKVFIREGQENARAYIIQNGEICAYITQDDKKVEVARYGPGTIIDEMCLVLDEPAKMSYEAIDAVTVVTITRDDFQKRLTKTDKTVATILDHIIKKLCEYEAALMDKIVKKSEIDPTVEILVKSLTKGLDDEKRASYEEAMTPHLDGLMKAIKDIKSKHKAGL